MSNRYSNARDRTLQTSCPGIGVAYTQVKPTAAELALRAKQTKRVQAAKEKPQREVTLPWPPGFVSAIKVNKHGQMI
jgi:hypothetical protein